MCYQFIMNLEISKDNIKIQPAIKNVQNQAKTSNSKGKLIFWNFLKNI